MAFIPRGIIPPVVTPTDENGSFNPVMFDKLLNHLLEGGVHGVFPFGTTGEFYAFDEDDYRRIITQAVETVNHRVPVYAGANSITTKGTIRLAKVAKECGADALSVLTPMFISQTQAELYEHYRAIAESTDLPIIIYNNRPKTNVHVTPETVAKLAEIPNIIAIKDSTGDMTNTAEYIRLTRHRDDFHVLMGRDTLIYAALCYGATGAIASCANVAPKVAVAIYEKFMAGDHAGALEAQFTLAPLRIATNMGTFPEVIKEGLQMQGIDVGKCVAPIAELTPEEKQKLYAVLQKMGLVQ